MFILATTITAMMGATTSASSTTPTPQHTETAMVGSEAAVAGARDATVSGHWYVFFSFRFLIIMLMFILDPQRPPQ